MNIYINGRFLTKQITGEQRYALELTQAIDSILDQRDHEEHWCFLVPKGTRLPENAVYKHIGLKEVGYLHGHAWEQFELPFYSKGSLLLNFCDMAPIFKSNQIVTIHDMALKDHPEFFTKVFLNWHKFVFSFTVHRSKKICTVSNFSKSRLMKYYHLPSNGVCIVPCACSGIFKRDALGIDIYKKWNLDKNKKIILAVSSMSPNKNFKGVVEAFEYLNNDDVQIVIAGGANPKVFASHKKSINPNIKYVGYVTDDELLMLYKCADCFIYPSFYEGFGLPPLEAMTNGCPVVVSEQDALKETCGKAAVYCNPSNPKNIAEGINSLIDNDKLRTNQIKLGYEQSEKFSWEKSAKVYLSVIESLKEEQ